MIELFLIVLALIGTLMMFATAGARWRYQIAVQRSRPKPPRTPYPVKPVAIILAGGAIWLALLFGVASWLAALALSALVAVSAYQFSRRRF